MSPASTARLPVRGLVAAVAVLATVLAVRAFVLEPVRVTSASMSPTLCTGDVVLVSHLGAAHGLAAGDIVTFPRPGDGAPTVKRVVGLAGQRVALVDARLEVDGAPVDEPYVDLAAIDGTYYGPVTVPAGTVLVMGDEREISVDSRSWGPVPVSSIDGRVVAHPWTTCAETAPGRGELS